MKKKVIKTLITATALSSSVPAENLSDQTIIEEIKIKDEIETENKTKSKKRTKRQTTTANPPSLEEITTRVDIGELEVNDKMHIIQRLREMNHSIISRKDFLANIEFENITSNSAVIYTNTDIIYNTPSGTPLPILLYKFTISFTTQSTLLSSVLINTDLGELPDNRLSTILNRLNELNHNLYLSPPRIFTSFIGTNSFIIDPQDINNFQIPNQHIIFDCDLNLTFTAQRIALSNILRNTNTDLGELPDNRLSTILNRWSDLTRNNFRFENFIIDLTRNNICNREITPFVTTNRLQVPLSTLGILQGLNMLNSNTNLYVDCGFNLTFTTQNISLSSILRNTDLGELPNSRKSTILDRVTQLNPGINRNNIDISLTQTYNIRGGNRGTRQKWVIKDTTKQYWNRYCTVYLIINKNKTTPSSDIQPPTPSLSTTPPPPPGGNAGGGSSSVLTPPTSVRNPSFIPIPSTSFTHPSQSNSKNQSSKNEKRKMINTNLLEIYKSTDNNTKSEVKFLLKEIYGTHFTDDSWNHFEKFVKLHEYGVVFIPSNKEKNDKIKETTLVTAGAITAPVGYLLVKSLVSSASKAVQAEETIPLLDISEEGAMVVEEGAVFADASIIMAEGAVLGPVGLIVGGVIVVGVVAHVIYNWEHANNSNVNSQNQNDYILRNSYYTPTGPDIVMESSITTNSWIKFAEIYQEYKNDYYTFEKEMLKKLNNFQKEQWSYNPRGFVAQSKFYDDNLKILTKVIYDNFQKINIFYMMTNQHGWKIITNNNGTICNINEQ